MKVGEVFMCPPNSLPQDCSAPPSCTCAGADVLGRVDVVEISNAILKIDSLRERLYNILPKEYRDELND